MDREDPFFGGPVAKPAKTNEQLPKSAERPAFVPGVEEHTFSLSPG